MLQDVTPKKGEPEPPAWYEAFLAALSVSGVVTRAAEAAKITTMTAYRHRADDPEFAERWRLALEASTDLLIFEARRRAHNGVQEPVVWQGKLAGVWVNEQGEAVSETTPGAKLIPLTVTKYSDTLLIFLIKGQRADYRDQKVALEHSGPEGGPIHHEHKGKIDVFARIDTYAEAFQDASRREAEDDAEQGGLPEGSVPADGPGEPLDSDNGDEAEP